MLAARHKFTDLIIGSDSQVNVNNLGCPLSAWNRKASLSAALMGSHEHDLDLSLSRYVNKMPYCSFRLLFSLDSKHAT